MLYLEIPPKEMFDERTMEFIELPAKKLQMEHSLVSLSKWESKWHKPFLVPENRTHEETLDYFRCMTITQNVDPSIYETFDQSDIQTILDYIDDPMTATWFNERQGPGPRSREIVTAEVIYYDMIALNIPFECQKWHLNRLITLIKVCKIKNQPPSKMSKAEALNQQRALNAQRKAKMNTKG